MDQNPFVLAKNPFRPIFMWVVLGLLGPIMLAVGVAMLPSPAWQGYVLRERGVLANAVVTGVLFREHNLPTGRPTVLAIRFPTPAGTVDEELRVVDTNLQDVAVGDPVSVVYDPRDPARVRPSGALLSSDFWWALEFLLGGGTIVVVGIVRIVAAIGRRLRGTPVPG